MSKFLFIKLSEIATLKRNHITFTLKSSSFDPVTDFSGEITSICQYFIREGKGKCFPSFGETLQWIQGSKVDISQLVNRLFVKKPLVLLIAENPDGEKYRIVFYLSDIDIVDHEMSYTFDYSHCLGPDILSVLSENWSFPIKNATLFIDKTRNLDRLSSYQLVSRDIFRDLDPDIPVLI